MNRRFFRQLAPTSLVYILALYATLCVCNVTFAQTLPAAFHEEEERDEEEHDEEGEEQDLNILYGSVQGVDIDEQSFFVEDILVIAEDIEEPLLLALSPGMFVEVEGLWLDDEFEAQGLVILEPDTWLFYDGPAEIIHEGGGTQRLLYWRFSDDEGDGIERWLLEKSKDVRVIAFYDGEELLYSNDELPSFRMLTDKWYMFEGEFIHGTIAWYRINLLFDDD